MPKLIMTKGLPGCGKTTWAKQYQVENPNTVRVNKDDLRAMLHNSVHSKGREAFVIEMRDRIVDKALKEGHDVIVDDTNLNPIHESALRFFAQTCKAEFVIQSFLDVPIPVCIERDLKRFNSVGSKVIYQQYNQWLKPKPFPTPPHEYGLDFAVVCDLDGTLALFGDKDPYERDFINDESNVPVRVALKAMKKNGSKIIIVSGRKDTFKEETEKWLVKHGIEYDFIFMRKGDDNRKDSIVKQEIYEEHLKGKFNIDFILDDRNQVVDFWRSIGIPCFQVADGDF